MSRHARRKVRDLETRRAGKKLLFGLVALVLGLGSVQGRELPPLVPSPKPVFIPPPATRVLPNGLRVVVIERHFLPLLTLRLVVRTGAEADPPRLHGTAQIVAALLDQGTARRSAQKIAETIDAVGGVIDTGAEWDKSYAALSTLSEHADLAFDLLSDMVLHPAFEKAEVERKRKQTLSALEVLHNDPNYLADTAVTEIALSGTPYGHAEDGTSETLSRLTPESFRAFHNRYYRPSNSILAVVGDVSVAEAFDHAEKYFGGWEDPRVPQVESTSPALSWASSRQVLVIDKPDSVQTEIRIANPGVPRASPEFYVLSLANQILGGPAANRLFRTLRSRQGLTYGASSDLIAHRSLGIWIAKTSTRSLETLKAVQLSLEQMKRLRNHTISGEELETAKSYLVGHLALEFETAEGIANQVLTLMLHGLPLDYWNHYPEQIRTLDAQEVLAATRQYLDPDRATIVLVGNAASFRKDLKKLGRVRIIPVASVDFASANLERTQGAAGKQ